MDDPTALEEEYLPPRHDEPPPHRAARTGDLEAIRRLVVTGAEIDATFDVALDSTGRRVFATPLMVAAGSGDGADVNTVQLLLELGADAKIEVDGGTPVSFAALGLGWGYRPSADAARLRLLVDAGGQAPSDPEESNRLLCAVAGSGDLDLLQEITRLAFDPNGYWDKAHAEMWHRELDASLEADRQATMAEGGEV